MRDRVAQAAALLILEPIFESDFMECSYGFRPGKSAHDALDALRTNLAQGFVAVYDADLSGYFDSIPHAKLMKCLADANQRPIRAEAHPAVVERARG